MDTQPTGKWPASITLIRHGESVYNELRPRKNAHPLYQSFLEAYESDPDSPRSHELADAVWKEFRLNHADHTTPLNERGHDQAFQTGQGLPKLIEPPDAVFVSPYTRTMETFTGLQRGGFAREVEPVYDARIREQEHGLVIIYSDWRVFNVKFPEQRLLRELTGPFFYQHPQGESVPNVQDRLRSFLNTLTRDYVGRHVVLVTHHLTILAFRSIIERLTPEEFITLDEHETPKNLGVTTYVCDPTQGKNGKLVRTRYNEVLWK